MPLQGIPRKKEIDPFLDTVCPLRASRVINIQICGYEEKEIVPFLDTVCPLRASRVINVPICDYEEEKKEIDPFLDTVCPFRASRVMNSGCKLISIIFVAGHSFY